MSGRIRTVLADYADPRHCRDIVALLDSYARDPMGGGKPLSAAVRAELCRKLSELPYAFSVLCYIDDAAVGLANCFDGFSTFSCTPLVNIHDMAVAPAYRGRGIGQRLLAAVEEIASEKGCSKITLEVLEGNEAARRAYEKFGFEGYELDPEMGKALFWQKTIRN